MHGNYHFLMKINPDASDTDIAQEAEGNFDSWLDRNGDENNWASVKFVILRNNKIITLSDSPEDTQKYLSVEFAKYSLNPFDWAVRMALSCVVTDMKIFNVPLISLTPLSDEQEKIYDRLYTQPLEDIIAEIKLLASSKIVELYSQHLEGLKAGSSGQMFEGYHRRTLVTNYEKFFDSTVKPFAGYGNPYEYRAFDLEQSGELTDHSAILVADIHT